MREEMELLKAENGQMRQDLSDKERSEAEHRNLVDRLTSERDSYKRQLDDIKTTVEFQEARMDSAASKATDGGVTVSPSPVQTTSSRSSAERRSLRRRRHEKSRGDSVSQFEAFCIAHFCIFEISYSHTGSSSRSAFLSLSAPSNVVIFIDDRHQQGRGLWRLDRL